MSHIGDEKFREDINEYQEKFNKLEDKTPTKTKIDLSVESKVKKVNEVLKSGEPNNISKDGYTNYTGYKPQYIIDAMNQVFGIGGWGFEEIQTHTVAGEQQLAVTQVKVWIKDIGFMPVGWGQSRVTRGDVGDAKKGAQTDAIKKALSYFSIGNRAYHGLLEVK